MKHLARLFLLVISAASESLGQGLILNERWGKVVMKTHVTWRTFHWTEPDGCSDPVPLLINRVTLTVAVSVPGSMSRRGSGGGRGVNCTASSQIMYAFELRRLKTGAQFCVPLTPIQACVPLMSIPVYYPLMTGAAGSPHGAPWRSKSACLINHQRLEPQHDLLSLWGPICIAKLFWGIWWLS